MAFYIINNVIYVNLSELARLANVSKSVVQYWIKTGMPHMKKRYDDNCLLIPLEQAQRWLVKHKRKCDPAVFEIDKFENPFVNYDQVFTGHVKIERRPSPNKRRVAKRKKRK